MATPVIMPRQGQSVESCIITKWHKKKGDPVRIGDILFSYETDKASFDEEAKVEGLLLEVFFQEDDDVPVLTNVAVIGQEGENTAGYNPAGALVAESKKDEPAKTFTNTTVSQVPETIASVLIPASAGEMSSVDIRAISPRARNLAERSGVDPRYAVPSGPEGRIIERDIITLQEKGAVFTPPARAEAIYSGGSPAYAPASARGTGLGSRITTRDLTVQTVQEIGEPYQEVKLPNIRKMIAKAMHTSLSSTAQLTLNTSFDATDILEYRRKVKETKDRYNLENITLNDIILYTVSRTLLNHKDLNAHFLEDKMRFFNHTHLGIATDTDRGLMVPTLFNADLKSLNQISREVKELVQECKKGTINPDLLKGGTFTITNLGALDIESFTPVLNPPQTGILGVNNIIQRVKEHDGAFKYYPAMGLSLTFDHRALDGAPAARFLKDLTINLENFTVLLTAGGN